MKKLLPIALLIYSCTIFIGCKKDAVSLKSDNAAIVSRWAYQKDSINFYMNGKKVNTQVVTYDGNKYMEFYKNGTGEDEKRTFTYVVSDTKLTLHYQAYSVVISTGGDQAIVPAETNITTIQALTANKLVIVYDFTTKDPNGLISGSTTYAYLTR